MSQNIVYNLSSLESPNEENIIQTLVERFKSQKYHVKYFFQNIANDHQIQN